MADLPISGLPTAGTLSGAEVIPLTQAGVTSKVSISNLLGFTGTKTLSNRIIVKQASQLAGTLSSTSEYFIDGVIDMGSQSIEVPAGGLNLSGYNFELSKLISSAVGYTMFTSPVGGSGDLLGKDYSIEVTGSGSKVYELVADTGVEAFEFARINYNNCTSLGSIEGYRQGLEIGSGRFGGTPTLELKGTWLGGYFIDTSIVRGLSPTMNAPLFKAGAGFVMNSRFRSNQNIDLGNTASFFDFSPSNFVSASTVQLEGCIITRGGVFNPVDTNITPNMSSGDLVAKWKENVGLSNTLEGGRLRASVELVTTINTVDVYEPLNSTWVAIRLEHFDSPANGQLRHLGDTPREYDLLGDLTIEGTQGNSVQINVRRWDNSASMFVDEFSQTRQINNFAGGRDVSFFTLIGTVILDKNDYIFLQVRNRSNSNDVSAEVDSFFTVKER